MNFLSVLSVAASLAMDSFAVSLSAGTACTYGKYKPAALVGAVFGFFQGFMPVLGWLSGIYFAGLVNAYAPYIAFVILCIIGIKMIEEGFSGKEEKRVTGLDKKMSLLIMLGIATSIDALAVGVSLAFLEESILVPAIVIGLFTFVLSFFGFFTGDKLGSFAGKYAEIAGGIILIAMGFKFLIEAVFI
ncbi:putative Mn2+ efflux pump MntP [Methanomicrobium sp. W14]|uniref:manganese efflux pump MntP n=1 Tax=Methanomicrobium sp. W14 TaxID=2817839 RepID=UPI001AE61A0F|nr:manganese efflux pump MntP family protein [Methanomicrobium sp. W14]MBP2132888.1 putative Mn2+ efflux pump MntP [Methanomicrobium sp. W14]